jgi:2-iminoacetate synthase
MFAPLYQLQLLRQRLRLLPVNTPGTRAFPRKKLPPEEIVREVTALQICGTSGSRWSGRDPVNNPIEYNLESIKTSNQSSIKTAPSRR